MPSSISSFVTKTGFLNSLSLKIVAEQKCSYFPDPSYIKSPEIIPPFSSIVRLDTFAYSFTLSKDNS